MAERIHLSPPDIGPSEREAVLAALDSGWITTLGPSVDAFEQEMATFTGAPYAVALSSGTAALHLALLGVGVRPGSEVLVSTLTFAASVNAIAYCGASPVLLDSEHRTWNLDPQLLEDELRELAAQGRRPAAVVAVDVFGQCADYGALSEICSRYDVPLVEDAAESLGASWGGQPAGSFGAAAILSFNGNKIMTTSGGGMLLTGNELLARRARHLATQAREPVRHYEHCEIGFNYRLSNLLAGLGSAQLRRLPEMIERRRTIRAQYEVLLGGLPGIAFQPQPEPSRPNAWMTALRIEAGPAAVAAVLDALAAEAIEARPVWKPMHAQPVFAGCRSRLSGVADAVFHSGVCLPSGSALSTADIERICSAFTRALQEVAA